MFGRILAAAGAGAFLALVGPPTNAYPALWLGMAALAYIVQRPSPAPRRFRSLRRVFEGTGAGLAFGVGANVVFFRFVPNVVARFTGMSLSAGVACLGILAVLQGLVWAVAAGVHAQLARRGVPSWVSFGVGVYAGTFVPAIFRWTPAGPLSPMPEMIQLAELAGERGVTLLMALSAGLLAAALEPRGRRARALLLSAGLALPLLTYAEGTLRIARVERDRRDAPTATLGLVDPSSEARLRWDASKAAQILATLTSLTRSSESQGAELTIWSEGAYPHPLNHDSRKAPEGERAILGPGLHGPVLAGFVGLRTYREQYNSAALVTSDGAIGVPYDKIRLLAFGETVPLIGGIPWVRKTFARAFALFPGAGNVIQASGRVRASVLICVEDVLPESGRQAMADHPNLLVNLTNDAWFSGSHEPELHLRLAVMRAIEMKTTVPGPRSSEILERKRRVVADPLSIHAPVVVESGQGATVVDVDGNTLIDFTGGVGCLNVGHAHPRVTAAVQEQAERFLHTDFSVIPYELYVTLAERLLALTPISGRTKAAFFNAGTEAVENAIKFARSYTKRPAVIAFEGGFHGRTLLSLSLTSKVHPYKAGLGPFAPEVYRVPFPNDYRGPDARAALDALERSFDVHVPAEQVAAIVIEPVQGEGGFLVCPRYFMTGLRRICDERGIVLVVDEVQTGVARTGRFFAIEHYGVEPDLITVAKSIAAGLPLSGVLGRAEIMDAPPDSAIGGTYVGNPVAQAAAIAVLDVVEDEGLCERADAIGEQIRTRMTAWQGRFDQIGDVRGLGAMLAIELVHDRETKAPAPELATAVVDAAMARGLLLLKAGVYSNVIRVLLPLVIGEAELDEGLDAWEDALEAVLGNSD